MNWHETIIHIQQQPEFAEIIREAYITPDLVDNVRRFESSLEFQETLWLLSQFAAGARTVLDIGSGNGISAAAFALNGFAVTALEPDPSDMVGTGAIRKVKSALKLENLEIREGFAEALDNDVASESGPFDLVYIRQAMHHANDLEAFVRNAAAQVKRGGTVMTARDHVVYDDRDKALFLETHPLHRYYGGENAFTEAEYRSAFQKAGLQLVSAMRHFDSVINYAPMTPEEVERLPQAMQKRLSRVAGPLADSPKLQRAVMSLRSLLGKPVYNERHFPGRLRTYILRKP